MIFVLEAHFNAEPRAWFAFGGQDLLRKVAADDALQPWEIWDCSSARELLETFDESPGAAGVAERFPGLCALGAEQGWDTPLYRADHLLGRGQYQATPVSELQACEAALQARGSARVWADESLAVLAMENDNDPLWQGLGWKARLALREQLIATEALAEG